MIKSIIQRSKDNTQNVLVHLSWNALNSHNLKEICDIVGERMSEFIVSES